MERENSKNKETVKRSRFLSFFVNEEQYGIDISSIKEIIAIMEITDIPRTPDFIEGVVNLRGLIIPVVDVRSKFGLEKKEHDMNTAIIIYEIKGVGIGFIVDRVEDVLTIDNDELSKPPEFGSNINTEFIKYVSEVDKNVILILDMDKIFEDDEISKISTLNKDKTNNTQEIGA